MKQDSIDTLLEQAAVLKKKLVEFGSKTSIMPHFQEMLWDMGAFPAALSEQDQIAYFDQFLFEWLLPNGDTVRHRMWKLQTKALSPAEREMLARWEDRVEGIFHIEKSDDDGAYCYNLVDGLHYRVYTNRGVKATADYFKKDSFVYAPIVPVEDFWMLSGSSRIFPKKQAQEVITLAQQLAQSNPKAAFRNPEKLHLAWERSAEMARAFQDCFGSDVVVITPRQLQETLTRFFTYYTHTFQGSDGKTVAQRLDKDSEELAVPSMDLADMEEVGIHSVGLYAHPRQGLCFLIEYATILEAFETPKRASRGHHRRMVMEYIDEPSAPAAALERLASQDVKRLSQMIANATKRPDFDWERDHAALLSAKPTEDYPQLFLIDTARFEEYL
jgi:hypothetical protein